jgi:hypothetical protein
LRYAPLRARKSITENSSNRASHFTTIPNIYRQGDVLSMTFGYNRNIHRRYKLSNMLAERKHLTTEAGS